MEKVAITNKRQGTFSFTLYHAVYCASGGTCNCVVEKVLRPVGGGLQYVDLRHPVGVHLDGGATQEFEEAVRLVPQVAEALRLGILAEVKVSEAPPAPPAPKPKAALPKT